MLNINKNKYMYLQTHLISSVEEFFKVVQSLEIYGDCFHNANKIFELTLEKKDKKEFINECKRLNCHHIGQIFINYCIEEIA